MTLNSTGPDYGAIKQRQQAMWDSGDYSVVGTTLQIVGETLCERLDLIAGEDVLDVAAGNGNATLAAARRFADVTSTDYVGRLLDVGRARAAAEHLSIRFQEADAEALPFGDESFDVCLSTFGVMFAPHQALAASEMSRVLRRRGRIGLACWTPGGFIGQLFATVGRYVPPPAGLSSPALWGTEARLEELFPGHRIHAKRQYFQFRYASSGHWIDIFRNYYGPVHRAFASLAPEQAAALEADITDLLAEFNRCERGTLVVPSEYLEAVIIKP